MNLAPSHAFSALAMPKWPAQWYAVARSADLGAEKLISGTLADREFVLFRPASGALAALDAHCPHMGAHLRHGTVVGNRLQCPLHHREFAASGACERPQTGLPPARSWPVAERFGLIFLYPGYGAAPALPALSGAGQITWTTGRPFRLEADWRSLPINAFDISHLRTVHHRRLVAGPAFKRTADCVTLNYVSEVCGGGFPDRLMKYLSGNRIDVQLTCFGPVLCVESRVGRHRTAAILAFTQKNSDVEFFSAFGIDGDGALNRMKLAITKWLFSAFLRKDVGIVEHMALNLSTVDDPGVDTVHRFLAELPSLQS